MKSEPIWKAWFAKHGAKLLLFARQQARYPDDAEDLVQEASSEFGVCTAIR